MKLEIQKVFVRASINDASALIKGESFKEQQGYFLAEEQIKQLILNIIDDARQTVPHPDWDYIIEDKNEYINSLLNKK